VHERTLTEAPEYMPPSVALHKEVNDALSAALRASSEVEVRKIITDVNAQIREANRQGIRGPALMLVPCDVERVVRDWRAQHPGEDRGR
jgi:hypothetical protein